MEVSTQLSAVFSEVPDPRRDTLLKQHLLSDILLLSLFATLSGCDSDEEIEEYGRNKEVFLRQFLFLPNGIPSHDTITRVLNAVDQGSFAACLYRHSRYLCDFVEEHHISVDGKVLRATAQAGKRNSGICIVTAWACEQQVVLGQAKTEEKSNEKTAIPALLEELDLTGALVSIDAAVNGPAIAEQIVDQQGHYLLSLKKNQKNTFEQVEDYMVRYHPDMLNDQQVDFGSGRIETRTARRPPATYANALTYWKRHWPGRTFSLLLWCTRCEKPVPNGKKNTDSTSVTKPRHQPTSITKSESIGV